MPCLDISIEPSLVSDVNIEVQPREDNLLDSFVSAFLLSSLFFANNVKRLEESITTRLILLWVESSSKRLDDCSVDGGDIFLK